MNFTTLAQAFSAKDGVTISTMMGAPCLRYQGDFVAMMFEKQDALIIKVAAPRVLELIENGEGLEFKYTGKRFKEWVLIPIEFEDQYEHYITQALDYAKSKT